VNDPGPLDDDGTVTDAPTEPVERDVAGLGRPGDLCGVRLHEAQIPFLGFVFMPVAGIGSGLDVRHDAGPLVHLGQ